MGTEKRDRQKENRRQRLEVEAESWRREQRKRRFLVFGVIAVAVIAVVVITNLFKKDNGDQTASSTTIATSTTAAPASTVPVTLPAAGASIKGETPCPATDGSSERTTTFENAPPMCIDPAKTYQAVVATDKGDFTIELDPAEAPNTVNNFVVLSRYHYYDGVPFHRIIPGFVVQGGDATGPTPGEGGPGYTFADELPKSVDDYVPGSVAMANSGADTNGSQWFVWLGPNKLPTPAYSLFGTATEGMDVLKKIEAGGSEGGGPTDVTVIESVTIEES